MSSRLVSLIAPVVFVTVPLVCLAQRFGPSRGSDKTLLTGPLLLSPASPPQSPMPNQQWIFIRAANALEAARTASATPPAGTSTLLPDNAYSLGSQSAQPTAPRLRLANTPSASAALQLGHAAAFYSIPDGAGHPVRPEVPVATPLKRSRPSKRASAPDHFDAQVPPVPTHLLPDVKASPAPRP